MPALLKSNLMVTSKNSDSKFKVDSALYTTWEQKWENQTVGWQSPHSTRLNRPRAIWIWYGWQSRKPKVEAQKRDGGQDGNAKRVPWPMKSGSSRTGVLLTASSSPSKCPALFKYSTNVLNDEEMNEQKIRYTPAPQSVQGYRPCFPFGSNPPSTSHSVQDSEFLLCLYNKHFFGGAGVTA
jgi:hypothetical protein